MTSPWFTDRPVAAAVGILPSRVDVLVVGAGLVGLVTAVEAARRGRSVAVLEAGSPGGGATGSSSGIVSVLQGARLSTIRQAHPQSLVDAYVDANRQGREWLDAFAERSGLAMRDADVTVVANGSGVEAERLAAEAAGLRVDDVERHGFSDGIRLARQAVVDPRELVDALVAELAELGVPVLTECPVDDVRASRPVVAQTALGPIEADAVVLATGTPILERGLYFAKTAARRIRSAAFEGVPGLDEVLLPLDGPVRALHTATLDGRAVLVATGAPERVASGGVADWAIEDWVLERYPSARLVSRWWGIDLTSHDEMPFVGRMPRGRGRVWFATGFDGWGLTNAPAAAARIVSEIVGEEPPAWVRVIGRRVTVPADFGEGLDELRAVAGAAARAWRTAPRTPIARPRDGEGVIARHGLRAVGISTVDGVTRAVSATSPRLGLLVAWNRAERSWEASDGSRFGPDGTLIAGPAKRGLTPWGSRGAGRDR